MKNVIKRVIPVKLLNLKLLKLGSHLPIIICFNDSPSKMMKSAFYFILKAVSFLKIFKFLSDFLGM